MAITISSLLASFANARLSAEANQLRIDNKRMYAALEQLEYGTVEGETLKEYMMRVRQTARKGMGDA